MKALLLSAGLGTRLRPITDSKPKALATINGQTLLDINIQNLEKHGVTDIIVNVHHHASLIISHLQRNSYKAKIHISDETQQLMDTGGAIVHAQSLIKQGDPFIMHNVDVVSDIDLTALYSTHLCKKPLATLAVSMRDSSRKLLFNSKMRMCGWQNTSTNEIIMHLNTDDYSGYAFSGIHVISPEILEKIGTIAQSPLSIIKVYLRLCAENEIIGCDLPCTYMFDVGTIERLKRAETYLANRKEDANT